jgi:hypothetical protein
MLNQSNEHAKLQLETESEYSKYQYISSQSKTNADVQNCAAGISPQQIEKISKLRNDIVKFKYPINYLLAHKIQDINDINRMLKPSEFIVKKNRKYLKEFKIDLYEKSEKEIINYPKIRSVEVSAYEKSKRKLMHKIDLSFNQRADSTSGLSKLMTHEFITIESLPSKTFNPIVTKTQGFSINSNSPFSENLQIANKIKISLWKKPKGSQIFSKTLITQRNDPPEQIDHIKNFDLTFTNHFQLKFNKVLSKVKGSIRVGDLRGSITSEASPTEEGLIQTPPKALINLNKLGEKNLLLAKMQIQSKKKRFLKFEKVNEIKYKTILEPFKRSKFLEEKQPKDILV